MQYHAGTPVYTADSRRVGDLSGMVVDPIDRHATHLLVEKGFLLKEARLVPTESVELAGPEAIRLVSGIEPDDLIPYQETKYIPLREGEGPTGLAGRTPQTMLWYAPREPIPPFMGTAVVPSVVPVVERNIPPGTVSVRTGAEVISKDGKRLGKVSRVLTLGDTVTGFGVQRGLFFKKERLLPVNWVSSMAGPTLQLGVQAETVEQLPRAA